MLEKTIDNMEIVWYSIGEEKRGTSSDTDSPQSSEVAGERFLDEKEEAG